MKWCSLERSIGSIFLAGVLALNSGCYNQKDLLAYDHVQKNLPEQVLTDFVKKCNNKPCITLPGDGDMTCGKKWGPIEIDRAWVGREIRQTNNFREYLPQNLWLSTKLYFDDFEITRETPDLNYGIAPPP